MHEWLFTREGFDPEAEAWREAIFTLGNGYLATRGAAPEAVADGVHYPGTYVAVVTTGWSRASTAAKWRTRTWSTSRTGSR
jgi:trehalose/maltose hydrolase-like predicted phosphorylase